MNKEDLRLRSWYGEGYHSGASKFEVLVYDINDKELLERDCKFFDREERYLGELDGKHSEVYGEINEEDEDDFEYIINTYKLKDTDVFKAEFYREEDSEVYKALKKAFEFVNSFKIVKTYRNRLTGEILNMDDYENFEEVVEK